MLLWGKLTQYLENGCKHKRSTQVMSHCKTSACKTEVCEGNGILKDKRLFIVFSLCCFTLRFCVAINAFEFVASVSVLQLIFSLFWLVKRAVPIHCRTRSSDAANLQFYTFKKGKIYKGCQQLLIHLAAAVLLGTCG